MKTVKALLEEHGIEHQELAKWIGISKSGLSRKLNARPWMMGGRRWTLYEVVRLKAFLSQRGININALELYETAGLLTKSGRGLVPAPTKGKSND